MLTVQVCSPCGEVLSDAWVSLVDPSSPALCASPAAVPGRPLDGADKGAAKPSTTVALKTERTFADVAKVVGFIVRAELAGHVQRVAAPPIAPSSEAGEDQVSCCLPLPAALLLLLLLLLLLPLYRDVSFAHFTARSPPPPPPPLAKPGDRGDPQP